MLLILFWNVANTFKKQCIFSSEKNSSVYLIVRYHFGKQTVFWKNDFVFISSILKLLNLVSD